MVFGWVLELAVVAVAWAGSGLTWSAWTTKRL